MHIRLNLRRPTQFPKHFPAVFLTGLLLCALLLGMTGCRSVHPPLRNPAKELGNALDAEITLEENELTAVLTVHLGMVSDTASGTTSGAARESELLFLSPASLKGLSVLENSDGGICVRLGDLEVPAFPRGHFQTAITLLSPGEISGKETREVSGVTYLIFRLSDGRTLYCDPETAAIRKILRGETTLTVHWLEFRAG